LVAAPKRLKPGKTVALAKTARVAVRVNWRRVVMKKLPV
jgi:hypothetical protein